MKRNIIALALALAVLPSCAWSTKNILPVLQDVLLVGEDAIAILNAIHAAEVIFFLAHNDPVMQAKVESAIGDVSTALDAAIQAASGAKDLSANDADAAFAAFRQSYQDLVALLGKLGIAQQSPQGKLGLRRGGEMVWHQPLALQRRVGG